MGGGPGNLYVTIHVQAHALFQREGDDLIYDLPLNFVQAALGGEARGRHGGKQTGCSLAGE